MISNPPYPSSLLHATAFFFIFTKLIVIMEIFGKTLRDYLWPVKWYVIASVIVVVFQYEGMLATGYDPLMARITQWLWEIFVAAAVFTLVWKHDFGPKHIFFTGILFSVIIHGLKAFVFRVFFFPYPSESWPWLHIGKFLYGSALVMAVTLAIGLAAYYYKHGKSK